MTQEAIKRAETPLFSCPICKKIRHYKDMRRGVVCKKCHALGISKDNLK